MVRGLFKSTKHGEEVLSQTQSRSITHTPYKHFSLWANVFIRECVSGYTRRTFPQRTTSL